MVFFGVKCWRAFSEVERGGHFWGGGGWWLEL